MISLTRLNPCILNFKRWTYTPCKLMSSKWYNINYLHLYWTNIFLYLELCILLQTFSLSLGVDSSLSRLYSSKLSIISVVFFTSSAFIRSDSFLVTFIISVATSINWVSLLIACDWEVLNVRLFVNETMKV